MKRICITLLFAAAIITWVAVGRDAATPMVRTLLMGAIVVLALWKAADFWKRHAGQPLSSEDADSD
jgi:hypothetical protein